MAIKLTPALLTASITSEEERTIISSFNEDQLALFHQMRTTYILARAGLQYDIERPTYHVTEAARYDGMVSILTVLLGYVQSTSLDSEE